jgi:3-methylcrotonyl-CoA carboxylase alpha subunit
MKIVTIRDVQTEVEPDRGIIVALREDEVEVRMDGKTYILPYVIQGATVSFVFEGETYTADVSDKGARAKARHRDHSMSAPMPGVVTKILVQQGDVVAKGAALLVLEAMKMEHQIVAPRDGKVVAIHCKEGELVQPGADLIELSA